MMQRSLCLLSHARVTPITSQITTRSPRPCSSRKIAPFQVFGSRDRHFVAQSPPEPLSASASSSPSPSPSPSSSSTAGSLDRQAIFKQSLRFDRDRNGIRTENTKRSNWSTMILFLLFGIPAIVCFYLGIWQTQRYHWKKGLLGQRQAQSQRPDLSSTDIPAANSITSREDLEKHEHLYRRFALEGTFLHDKEMHIGLRTLPNGDGEVGFFLITPFKLTDGRVILLNRGWVPLDLKEKIARPETLISGVQRVLAILRPSEKGNRFVPPSDTTNNFWTTFDAPTMAQHGGEEHTIPLLFDVVGMEKCDTQLPVMTKEGAYTYFQIMPETHVGYALTWFGVSIGSVVIGTSLFRKGKTPSSRSWR